MAAMLCRHFALKGMRTSPFKAQNLSLNSYVTSTGEEIGISQAYQAWACGAEPHWSMNPVLLKPHRGQGMQIVLKGRPLMDAGPGRPVPREVLMDAVREAYGVAAGRSDMVVLEGSGGAAEINLAERDIANMATAEMADAPVVLVGDIERGGVFAGLYGTFMLLPPERRRRVKAFIINRFRGDASILGPGIERLEELTGVPCAGVLPFAQLRMPAEDSLDMGRDRAPMPGSEDVRHVWMESLDELYRRSRDHLDYPLLERVAAGE
ncbi:cobyric acid synthase [Methanomassiliicoccales archaeon RumEn M1]|nr:cobyric acid synthase [Methanomassiliicoccales archaeon RumEn M1]